MIKVDRVENFGGMVYVYGSKVVNKNIKLNYSKERGEYPCCNYCNDNMGDTVK